MRANTKIYFIQEGAEEYDPSTGDYTVSEPSKDLQWANVSDAGTERMALLYGSIQQGAKTVRLNRGYNKPFDYIEINGTQYKSKLNKDLKKQRVFEVVGI